LLRNNSHIVLIEPQRFAKLRKPEFWGARKNQIANMPQSMALKSSIFTRKKASAEPCGTDLLEGGLPLKLKTCSIGLPESITMRRR
jgi:hypothetical protein